MEGGNNKLYNRKKTEIDWPNTKRVMNRQKRGQAECIMDLPDDKCQMKRIIERKEKRRAKRDCMEEMSDKKNKHRDKNKVGRKII